MNPYPIAKLTTDFDETITVEDTIANIAFAAADNLGVGRGKFLQSWNRVVEQFANEYIKFFEMLLNQPQPTEDKYDALSKFLLAFDEAELASIERVIRGNFLKGIKREKLREIGKNIKKQADVEVVLSKMREAGIQINIISANWSKDLIIGAMDNLYDNIVSNDLEFDQNGISTGQINLHVLSPFDKLKHYRCLKSEKGNNLYIGDSASDLLAILEAEIGVLFGPGKRVMRVISRYNLPFRELTDEDRFSKIQFHKGTIFIVDSWKQLDTFLTT